MAENTLTESTPAGVPAKPADEENEALIDARTTFLITVGGAILFCLAAAFIIMSTRMG